MSVEQIPLFKGRDSQIGLKKKKVHRGHSFIHLTKVWVRHCSWQWNVSWTIIYQPRSSNVFLLPGPPSSDGLATQPVLQTEFLVIVLVSSLAPLPHS